MKIISITRGPFDKIITDEIEPLREYFRFSASRWFTKMDRNGGTLLKINDPTMIENIYQLFMKEHGERNPNNITNA